MCIHVTAAITFPRGRCSMIQSWHFHPIAWVWVLQILSLCLFKYLCRLALWFCAYLQVIATKTSMSKFSFLFVPFSFPQGKTAHITNLKKEMCFCMSEVWNGVAYLLQENEYLMEMILSLDVHLWNVYSQTRQDTCPKHAHPNLSEQWVYVCQDGPLYVNLVGWDGYEV